MDRVKLVEGPVDTTWFSGEGDIPARGWAVRPSRGTVPGDRTRGDGPAVLAAAHQRRV